MSEKKLTKEKVKFKVSPYYYMVKSGKKTWYWDRKTGRFDGTDWEVN